jgi:hypothetical protein
VKPLPSCDLLKARLVTNLLQKAPFGKEGTNTVAEATRLILSAHGQECPEANTDKQSHGFMRPVLVLHRHWVPIIMVHD